MEKEPKIGQSLEGDSAIPEFNKEELGSEVSENTDGKESELNSDKDAYLKESFNRHWMEIIQDHIDEWPEKERGLLDRALSNLQENKKPTAHLGNKKQRFLFARSDLWRKIFGIKFSEWESMQQSTIDRGIYSTGNKGSEINSKSGTDTFTQYGQMGSWENEGGALSESLEDIKKKPWLQIVADAKSEFPPDTQELIDKRLKGAIISQEELIDLKVTVQNWWKERFGLDLFQVPALGKIVKKIRKAKQEIHKKEQIQSKKVAEMEQLHRTLKDLDDGEPINEFREEDRKVIYYDEEKNKYYIGENGERKYLGIGDITSDYAWGIKYVPDGEMTEPAYRALAKRILINEARRDIEILNDEELTTKKTIEIHQPINIERKVLAMEDNLKRLNVLRNHIGFIAEVLARELLARTAINNDLGFAVLRADLVEDFEYKYDFKLRLSQKLRGVKIEDGESIEGSIRKIGIQFTIGHIGTEKKLAQVEKGREAVKKLAEGGLKRLPVDEILFLKIPIYKEIIKVYQDWLGAGKPSGGPEQFLSRDLKIRLLKEATKTFIEISDEDIQRIFPPN